MKEGITHILKCHLMIGEVRLCICTALMKSLLASGLEFNPSFTSILRFFYLMVFSNTYLFCIVLHTSFITLHAHSFNVTNGFENQYHLRTGFIRKIWTDSTLEPALKQSLKNVVVTLLLFKLLNIRAVEKRAHQISLSMLTFTPLAPNHSVRTLSVTIKTEVSNPPLI